MDQPANYLPYESTGYFSRIVTDYLSQSPGLQPFYLHSPNIAGISSAISARKQFATPRKLLVDVLEKQYDGIEVSQKTKANIRSLADENTFTVTTAHQPNIFTGPLYFIYKIIHTIRLSDELNAERPGEKFVPVYYMGSEDADIDELGHVFVGGRKLEWHTKQTGAVGRMKVDKALIKLISEIHGQTGVLPFGRQLTALFNSCYTEGKTIQQATLELVNFLFSDYGLVVLIPDNVQLKSAFTTVVVKELVEGFSHKAVSETIAALEKQYKVQAGGRELNLFYLVDDKRERIEIHGAKYEVRGLGLSFTRDEILDELKAHPERFSPNVILRGAFQETILPNIAFIGGGGELAYWLELKNVFGAVNIPYPVLLLRNSVLLLKKEQEERINKLGFSFEEIFSDEQTLLNTLVKRESENQLSLANEVHSLQELYAEIKKRSGSIDASLQDHISSLEAQALKKLAALEKKFLRAERAKFSVQQKQVAKLREDLFPGNSLQERVDNFSLYYARQGKEWLNLIYVVSTGFNKGFVIASI